MKIVALIENVQDDSKKLAYEHGLSLYVEAANRALLFDTGKTGAFVGNAKKLGIDLGKVATVVLSHGHPDHSGGLLAFFKENDRAVVYMKKEAEQDFFFNSFLSRRSISTDKKVFSEHANRIKFVDHLSDIGGIFLITEIEKKYATPAGNKFLFVRVGNQLIRDSFEHELMMVIRENNALTMFSGCSHNGVSNMIHTVEKVFAGEKLKVVIGGFHLMKMSKLKFLGPSSKAVGAIADKLKGASVERYTRGIAPESLPSKS